MDKYDTQILEIIRDYEEFNGSGIGMSVLDRKFYGVFNFSEAHLTERVIKLKEYGFIKKSRPYSLSEKGKNYLQSLK